VKQKRDYRHHIVTVGLISATNKSCDQAGVKAD